MASRTGLSVSHSIFGKQNPFERLGYISGLAGPVLASGIVNVASRTKLPVWNSICG